MQNKILILLPLFVLGGCAYTMDGALQNVKFVTPGAQNARCHALAGGVKYTVNPPETININRSKDDMVVECKAPGNRSRKVVIASKVQGSSGWNATNLGTGYAWDYASGALYGYPDVVEIDFTNAPVKPSALPAQDNSDIKPPDSYNLEEFHSSAPRLNADKNAKPAELLKRGHATTTSAPAFTPAPTPNKAEAFSEPSKMPSDKADLQTAPKAGKSAVPIPLFPGQ